MVTRIPVVTPSGLVFQSAYSQYWVDPAYDAAKFGTPTLAQKASFSTADYSRDFTGTIAQAEVVAHGATVSPAIAEIARTYPSIGVDLTKQPVTQTIADQSRASASLDELTAKLESSFGTGIAWITNNLLLVVILGAAVFVLPSLLSAAIPRTRRR